MVTMMVMMSIIVVVFLFAGTFDNQGNGLTNCDKVLLQQDVDRRWRLSRPLAEGRAESRQVAGCESPLTKGRKVSFFQCNRICESGGKQNACVPRQFAISVFMCERFKLSRHFSRPPFRVLPLLLR